MWTYKRYSLVDMFYLPVQSGLYKTKTEAINARNFDKRLGLKCDDIYEEVNQTLDFDGGKNDR